MSRALERMGRAFGEDFSDVGVELGADAEAGSHGAFAFTERGRIAFSSGRFAPGTPTGDRVLAHELAHVVQDRLGTASDPAIGVEALEAEAARAATAVLEGQSPRFDEHSAPPHNAGTPRVLRNGDEHETLVPVVFGTRDEARTVIFARLPEPSRAALGWVTGATIELEVEGRRIATARLTDEGAGVPEGVVSDGDGGARWWHHEAGSALTGAWTPRGIAVEEGSTRYLAILDARDTQAFRSALGTRTLILVRLRGGQGGTEGGEGAEAAAGETDPLPEWATTRFARLQERLRGEQMRIARVAQQTVGDTTAETLHRLYRLEGLPQRLALGRAGEAPAVQVTVVTGPASAPGGASPQTSASIPLVEADSPANSWERILTLARGLYLGRRDAATAPPQAVPPMGIPGSGEPDPEAVPPNAPAYPATIRYYGPPTGVVRASHTFAMELDYSELGEFAVFGHFALRWYAWDIYRIRDVAGAATEEGGRRVRRQEGAVAVLERGFGDIGEDLASSSLSELVSQRDLIAIDTAVRAIGTLVKSYVTLLSQPSDERTIQFDREGTYVIVCRSSQAPVHRTERIRNPVVRAPSVALHVLQVRTAQRIAADLTAATEVEAVDAEIARLEAEALTAPQDRLPALQEEIGRLRQQRATATAADQSDLPTHIGATGTNLRQQIALLEKLIRGDDPLDPAVRLLRVELTLSGTSAERALANARAALDSLLLQERALAELTDLKGTTYRPHMAFVPDADGRTLPLVMALAEHVDSTPERPRWVLVDLSTPGHRDRYEGTSNTAGATGTGRAIRQAFGRFAGATPYGRGWIHLRLPAALTDVIGTATVETSLRARPDSTGRFLQRLESLATAAALAGLVVTGPAGVALGVVGGIAGGVVAGHRLHRRHAGGYLEPDLQTAMDVAAIVGAAAGAAGAAASTVPRGSRFIRAAGMTIRGVEYYGYVQLAGSAFAIPVQYLNQMRAIANDPNLSEGERRARRAEAFLQVLNTSLQLAVTAAQMAGHARSGRADDPTAPRPVEEGIPPPPREEGTPRPREEGTPARPVEEGAPGRPVEEGVPVRPGDGAAVEDSVRTFGDARTGAVTIVPGSGTRSAYVAGRLYETTALRHPEAEVGLFVNPTTNERVIAIGDGQSVRLAHDDPNWTRLLPEESRGGGRWVLEQHSHPIDPVTGVTRRADYWPSGADGDFLGVVIEALTPPPHKATGGILVHTGGGRTLRGTYSYDPAAARPYSVEIPVPGRPAPYRRSYRTLEDFYADRAEHTGVPAPSEVPPSFPGATRARPRGAAEPAPGGSDAAPPPAARAPSSEPPTPGTRTERLRALEVAAAEAQASGDSVRSAAANRRLIEAQNEVRAGLEDTGLPAGTLARLLDTGISPDQIRTLRGWLGEGAASYLGGRLSPAEREALPRVADALAPHVSDPAFVDGLARLGAPPRGRGPRTIVPLLDGVPTTRMRRFVELLSDSGLGLTTPSESMLSLLKDPAVLDLSHSYPEFVASMVRGGAAARRRHEVLRNVAQRFATDQAAAGDYVRALDDAPDIRAMEAIVGLESPPRRVPIRPSATLRAYPERWDWGGHVDAAHRFVRDHPEFAPGVPRTPPDGPALTALVERLATLYQTRALARPGLEGLTHAERVHLLNEFIAAGREAGLVGDNAGVLNNLSGALAEGLFTPSGALTQRRLPHPEGGHTIIDYELPAAASVIPGRRNFVELKSNEVPDASLARAHVRDAIADAAAVAQAGGVHLIEYVRTPDPGTRARMLAELFGPTSPLQAVRFGDGPWILRTDRPAWLASEPPP